MSLEITADTAREAALAACDLEKIEVWLASMSPRERRALEDDLLREHQREARREAMVEAMLEVDSSQLRPGLTLEQRYGRGAFGGPGVSAAGY